MIEVSCPLCGQSQYQYFLSCQDFTVSHETFKLVECTNCKFLITNPRPQEEKIGSYYQSDAYISHTTSSKNIFEIMYRLARLYTLNWKVKLVKKHTRVSQPQILDYGCGTGNFLSSCQKAGFGITGVEPSPIARENSDEKIRSQIKPSLDLLTGETYDIITLWHVLEHLDKPIETIAQLLARLNPNGTIFIAVPNCKSEDANIYKEFWAAYDVPRHYWHFSQENMSMLANKFSLDIIETKAMLLDAYYVSILSEKYKNPDKKFKNLLSGFWQGFLSNKSASKTSEYSSLLYVLKKR